MAKYVFPAVFTQEVNGYSVNFPDVESCYTDADTLEDALERAEDVLQMMLADLEEDGKPIPQATPIKEIPVSANSFVVPVRCDTANELQPETESPQQFNLLISFMLEMLKSGQVQKVIELLEASKRTGQSA